MKTVYIHLNIPTAGKHAAPTGVRAKARRNGCHTARI